MKKRYDHSQYEAEIYKLWEESEAFTPPSPTKAQTDGMEPFTIIMPPPNANDPLHVGHAMFITIEDILIRYQRMRGKAALWLPGTDHAGIETQYVFEKKLAKQGKSRFSFDRETLYQKIWDYVQENSGVAVEQMKQLGASADWSRFSFMLDDEIVDLVLTTFETMHEDGLVERRLGLVNYCTKCGTAYSQLEMKYEERKSPLYYMKYGPFTLATVRPETKFGDTAVAVHPDDERYQDMVGSEIAVEGLLGSFTMQVIADEAVDPEFGTGVVKVTPAHDPNDFAMWQRHQDEIPGPKQVIGFNGKLTQETGPYAGMNVIQAREAVVKDLKEKGLIEKVDEQYTHNVATCYRCGRVIEPLPLSQFFVTVQPLVEPVLEALNAGEVEVIGAGHDKILRHWLENLHDWNISRQIVWGIRMPVWYEVQVKSQKSKVKSDNKQETSNNLDIVVGFLDKDGAYVQGKIGELLEEYEFSLIKDNLQTLMAPPEADYVLSREAPGEFYLQETDTFDTWFSSAQWPVNTLKTSGKDDFEYFYPTQVMETAYDILMFWVMRMLMMGIYLTGTPPFETVYLHGLVRDEKGDKMSKSKGNVVNPLTLVEKYGADALRMALVISTTPGHDSAVGESKVRGMRNFSNKIWNAARFIKMNRANDTSQMTNNKQSSSTNGQKFKQKLEKVVVQATRELEEYRIGQAAGTVHNEFWHWFCDESIEQMKNGELSLEMLEDGMQTFLKLIHPFMPYVTEVVWQELGYNKDGLLVTAEWPLIN